MLMLVNNCCPLHIFSPCVNVKSIYIYLIDLSDEKIGFVRLFEHGAHTIFRIVLKPEEQKHLFIVECFHQFCGFIGCRNFKNICYFSFHFCI